jgi:hypothetical protein
MPCDQRITTEVVLEKMDAKVLNAALRTLGWIDYSATTQYRSFWIPEYAVSALIDVKNNKLQISESNAAPSQAAEITKKLKVAYATEAVRSTARQFGWNVSQNKTDATKLKLTRRY